MCQSIRSAILVKVSINILNMLLIDQLAKEPYCQLRKPLYKIYIYKYINI